MKQMKAYINGKLISGDKWQKVSNPNDLSTAGEVPALSKEQIDHAFQAARDSFKEWKNLPLLKRIDYLNKFAKLLKENINELADIMLSEIAKPLKDCKSEIERTIEYVEYTNEEAKRITFEAQDGQGLGAKNKLAVFKREPHGVVLCISPFNYPVNLAMSKVAPALVTGNTVVFKGATQGSLSACFLGELFHKAGFPAGVINVVSGKGSEIGDHLIANKEINMISFTGGEKVGQELSHKSKMVPVVLELGGKDAAIVLEDANLKETASEIVKGAFSYSGQRCTAIKRILVKPKVADELVHLLTEEIKKLSVGKAIDNAFITPLIDVKTAENAKALIEDAKHKGAKVLVGGEVKDNLVHPTLVDNVTEKMRIAWDEPFAPILPVLRIESIDEMIRIHNHSDYGLQGSIFTQNTKVFLQIADQLETGTVNLNKSSARGPDSFPFIGVKNSGLGVQGIKESLLSCTRLKGLVFNY